MLRKCKNCGEEKTEFDYYARAASKDGLAFNCKVCSDSIATAWNAKNADARFETRRRSHLRRKFGITLEQYNEMLIDQAECCAICKRHASEFNIELAVDHNHRTGEVRGLLCTNCNYRLVAKHTDGDILRRIADYIEQGRGWFVPEQPKKKRKKRVVKNSVL